MRLQRILYFPSEAKAVIAETNFWTNEATAVNQPKSHYYKADKSIYLPEPFNSWAECWVLHISHYGND